MVAHLLWTCDVYIFEDYTIQISRTSTDVGGFIFFWNIISKRNFLRAPLRHFSCLRDTAVCKSTIGCIYVGPTLKPITAGPALQRGLLEYKVFAIPVFHNNPCLYILRKIIKKIPDWFTVVMFCLFCLKLSFKF